MLLAVESQAFGRVFRVGQTKHTVMSQMCVRNTIDEAIVSLQESKQIPIDAAMNDFSSKEKLSVMELMSLFGHVGEEDGKPFIFANQPDDDENEIQAARAAQTELTNEDDDEDMIGHEQTDDE